MVLAEPYCILLALLARKEAVVGAQTAAVGGASAMLDMRGMSYDIVRSVFCHGRFADLAL